MSGEPCVYKVGLSKTFMKWVIPDLYHMVLWFETTGYSADLATAKALIGPKAMDARAWFKHKGRWSTGGKFGEPDPPQANPCLAMFMLSAMMAGMGILMYHVAGDEISRM